MTELRKALERPVAGLVFDENRKNAVREKAFTAKRGGSALRRGAAVALVCTVLCVTAVAAGPTLWDALEARLGPYAPFAAEVEGEYSGPPGPLCRAGPDRGGGGVHQRGD